MNPATVQLILMVGQFALQYGIPAAQAIVAMFNKSPEQITQADWDAVWAKAQTPYGLTPNLPAKN